MLVMTPTLTKISIDKTDMLMSTHMIMFNDARITEDYYTPRDHGPDGP